MYLLVRCMKVCVYLLVRYMEVCVYLLVKYMEVCVCVGEVCRVRQSSCAGELCDRFIEFPVFRVPVCTPGPCDRRLEWLNE